MSISLPSFKICRWLWISYLLRQIR